MIWTCYTSEICERPAVDKKEMKEEEAYAK